MPTKNKALPGALYDRAGTYADELAAGQQAAADQMLAAWAEAYKGTRVEIDNLMAKIADAKATGQPLSPAWLYQQNRLKGVLNEAKTQMAHHATYASQVAIQQQQSAVLAALKHAEKMTALATAESLPGLEAGFTRVNPANLKHLVGFTADGSPLKDLFQSLPGEAGQRLESALVRGMALGWSPDKMRRQADLALDLPRWRAETIMRTEALRVYRYTARSTYMANAHVLGGWVWHAHLDGATCVACVLMDGTEHPLDEILDGHPRCRCAMVPRTQSWEELTGQKGLADTRPPVRSGKAWLEGQSPTIQQAIMGKARWNAWKDGKISLDDMVARPSHPAWGTMRRERSLAEIKAGANPNYQQAVVPPEPVGPKVHTPQADKAQALADQYDLDTLEKAAGAATEGGQLQANLQAAQAIHLNKLDYGPALPEIDQAKVAKAVEKLDNAALTKGYPSKGYSQTKAVYKAHASGTVGQPVGPLKALTLEQKLTAQAILKAHDESLPKVLRGAEKDAKIKAAHLESEGFAKKIIEDAGEQSATPHATAVGNLDLTIQAYKAEIDKTLNEILESGKVYPTEPTVLKVLRARLQAVEAVKEAYEDSRQGMLALRDESAIWVPKPDSKNVGTIEIGPDGWVKITYGDGGDQLVPPNRAGLILDEEWEPGSNLQPEADKVPGLVKSMADEDGYLNAELVATYEAHLDKMPLQGKVNVQAALAQAKATLLPKPEPKYVASLVQDLDSGALGISDAQKALATKTTPKAFGGQGPLSLQGQSNLKAALEQYEAKTKVVQANPQAVDAIVSHIEDGSLLVSDLAGQLADPNLPGQLGANIRAALAKVKAKAGLTDPHLDDLSKALAQAKAYKDSHNLPGPNPTQVQIWVDDLHSGSLEPEDMVPTGFTSQDAADAIAALEKYAAEVKATTAKVPTLIPPSPGPVVANLKDTGQVLGTHGARVYQDKTTGERWLWKPPVNTQDQFLATLDETASRISSRAGYQTPDTFVVTIGGKRGSIQRMFDAEDAFPSSFVPETLSAKDLAMVQREHVLDWLLSNHDGHVQQFIRLKNGDMVAIDKGQAFRWFGQDRLDWDFHPNAAYGAPPPVYNRLLADFAAGRDVDVRLETYLDAAKDLEAIPDDELRAMLRPYAEQAAAQGKLALPQPNYPGVVKGAALPTNDVDAFLDAVVARKNSLDADFTALYYKAAQQRAKALPDWMPTKPKGAAKTGKKKWVGAEQPDPPTPPETPTHQATSVFDGWLAKAKARYDQSPAKKSATAVLEDSNNWARFRKVIEDGDRQAAKELLDRQYLDQDLYEEALALIDQAEAVKASAQAAYDKAVVTYEKARKAYLKDLTDWREANGITSVVRGMDDGVIRHGTNPAGERWAQKHFQESRYTATERTTLKSYTGSAYGDWNQHLRSSEGHPTQYLDAYKRIDAAMTKQPIPEDVILHRGMGDSYGIKPFLLDGQRIGQNDDLTKLIGSVQVDHGYMSTSVGKNAAFSTHPVQLKIRCPAGTPGAYVQMFSNFGNERELILARGTHLFIHNAYKSQGRWVIECEVVPDDPTALGRIAAHVGQPMPSATPFSAS